MLGNANNNSQNLSLVKNLKTLASDSLIYGISYMLSRFIGIFLTPFYTRVYTPTDYGTMALLTSGYTLISIVIVLSLDNSTARWFYDTTDKCDQKITINTWIWFYFSLSIIVALLIFSCSSLIANGLFKGDKHAGTYIKLLAASLPLTVWSAVANNVLRFERKAIPAVSLSLFTNLTLIGLTILFVLVLKKGLLGAYYAMFLSAAIGMPCAFYLIKGWVGKPSLLNFKRLRAMLLYSSPFIPATLAYWVVNLSGVYFINGYLSKSEAGLYQIGTSIAGVAGLVTSSFQQAWAPFAFSIHKNEGAREVYAKVLYLYVLIVGFLCMLIALFTPEVLMMLTTPKYYDAAWVASILTFSNLFIGAVYIADIGAAIAKKTAPLGIISTISAFLIIGLNFLLIPRIGKEGAALAVCLAQLISPIYMFYRSQKLYYIPYNFPKVISTCVVIIIITLLGHVIAFGQLWLQILIKIFLVFLVSLIIYGTNKDQFNKMRLLIAQRFS